jgi:hypothetical protein
LMILSLLWKITAKNSKLNNWTGSIHFKIVTRVKCNFLLSIHSAFRLVSSDKLGFAAKKVVYCALLRGLIVPWCLSFYPLSGLCPTLRKINPHPLLTH